MLSQFSLFFWLNDIAYKWLLLVENEQSEKSVHLISNGLSVFCKDTFLKSRRDRRNEKVSSTKVVVRNFNRNMNHDPLLNIR